MPRPLVFGNGRMLVQLDDKSRIRDFFWPEVGIRNHVAGHKHHLGVWVDGRFSWTEWDEWDVSQTYLPDTMVGITTFECSALNLALETRDQVVEDTFLRQMSVTNLAENPREVEIFFSQDFRICESPIGDTALYHAGLDAMVHFKWNHYFICSGRSGAGGIRQKTAGLKGVDGLLGTWKDAEDGKLQQKPIEQGSVDSTFSILVECPASGSAWAEYRITCATSMPPLSTKLPALKPEPPLIPPIHGLESLPPEVQDIAARSLAVVLTQIGNEGQILAANDSDIMGGNLANYSYVWGRDAAQVAALLDRLDLHDYARRYHHFTANLISPDQPFLLQKYCADGSFGATWHPWIYDGVPETPFQEDETALTIWSMGFHAWATDDIEWLDKHYDGFIHPMACWLASGIKAGYDLWEERRGLHTYTRATIVAGLREAAIIAQQLEKPDAKLFDNAAEQTLENLLRDCIDPETGAFIRGFTSVSATENRRDTTVESSLLLVGHFAGLTPDFPAVVATNALVESELWVNSPIGGLARYTGDYYARVVETYPGNPWIITTMWLAQAKIRGAKQLADLERPLELLKWAVDRADSTGILGEQFHPDTGVNLTVSPLTWSHAEFIGTCLDWVEKRKELLETAASEV